MRPQYQLAWTLFLVVAGAVFGIIEGLALVDPASGDTLSEFMRGILLPHPAIVALLVGAIAWFLTHLLWRGRNDG